MSYLNMSGGIPDFEKAVISFWFRVPKESILSTIERSRQEQESDPHSTSPLFRYILPLVVFGKKQKLQRFRYLYGEISDNPNYPFYAFYDWTTEGELPFDVDPCYIGLYCYEDQKFDLAFNLQLETYGSYQNLSWVVNPPAVTAIVGGNYTHIITPKDTSPTVLYGQPEFFYVQTDEALALKMDEWHHLLLSFDLTGTLSIGAPFAHSNCKMWYAIDDKDYRGPENLQPYRDAPGDAFSGDGLEPNVILTENMYRNSGPINFNDFYGNPVPDPSGSYSPDPIPSDGEQFGIPASLIYMKYICRVEMAEFQMWTDVTLDTGEEDNRRAFIDHPRDADGNRTGDDLKPVNPNKAEELMGRKPDILLHGSGKWKKGYNTGRLGVDDDGNKLPSGQFDPTGGIKAYKPDPKILA